MLVYTSAAWVILATLLSSVVAQEGYVIFNDASFASPSGDFNGASSVFLLADIKDGKNFTLSYAGGEVIVFRLDLMKLDSNGTKLTLASWCPDNSCTSSAGFYITNVLGTIMTLGTTITLEALVIGQLSQHVGAKLFFRLDWQLNVAHWDKTSEWSQAWSVAQDQKAVTDVFQSYHSTMTAGASPVSGAGRAPTTVPDAIFFTASPDDTVSTTAATPDSAAPSTAAEDTGGTKGSKAWIAGPVVGGIAAICLLMLGVFLYQRRRQCRTAARTELEGDTFQGTGDKPQLHSDHLPPRYLHEMDASSAPCEADDGALPEMAADEAPARQLAATHHLSPSERDIDIMNPVVTTEVH